MVECECFQTSKLHHEGDYRFNRYMVECEFIISNLDKDKRNVLIDTWWNVNF